MIKDLRLEYIIYQKVNVIINGKTNYDKPIDSDIKLCEENRKLTTEQREDYSTERLLDYEYIKSHHRLITVDLSRQKKLHAKAVEWIGFVGKLKNLDGEGDANDAGNDQSMFALTVLEKINKTRLKFSQGSLTVL